MVIGDSFGMVYFITEVDSSGFGEMVKVSSVIISLTDVMESQSSCTSCWLLQPGALSEITIVPFGLAK